MAEKKSTKKTEKKVESTQYKITKNNGKVIYREIKYCGDVKVKRIKSKGWKVEEV
jgi:hypothetical protein